MAAAVLHEYNASCHTEEAQRHTQQYQRDIETDEKLQIRELTLFVRSIYKYTFFIHGQ